MPDLRAVLKELEEERNRLDEAIRTIRGLAGNSGRNGRTVTNNSAGRRATPKRRISPAARRRIIAAQKARWAKWRAKRKKAA